MADFSSDVVEHLAEAVQTRYAALQLDCVSLRFCLLNLALLQVHVVARDRHADLDRGRFRAHRAAPAPVDGGDLLDE
jgi:hypothetical protein